MIACSNPTSFPTARRANLSKVAVAQQVASAHAHIVAMIQTVETPVADFGYDRSTVDGLAMDPAEVENLAARHNLVEIAEACRREADACTMDPQPVSPICGSGRR